jgi:hypothetical protein
MTSLSDNTQLERWENRIRFCAFVISSRAFNLKLFIFFRRLIKATPISIYFSVFILLNSGCLVDLLAKGDCTMSTVSLVMALISNFLPCKDVHKMLCSHTGK